MIRFPDYETTGNQTASGHVVTTNVVFGGILVSTDGSNDVTFTVYKGSSAVDANALTPKNMVVKAANSYGGVFIRHPVRCAEGIYVAISGGSPNYVVYYANRSGGLH